MSDFETVRKALVFGSDHHPSTMEPVYLWTDADAALDRIEAALVTLAADLDELHFDRKFDDTTGPTLGDGT